MTQEEELERFIAAQGSRLLRIAFAVAGDWHLAEDAVQSALTKAFASWSRVQRADSPELYVRRIVIREARRACVSRGLVLEPRDDQTAPPVEDRHDLLVALRSLPDRQRAVIALRFLEDLSVEDTSKVLRCTTGTVKSQTSKALTSLRSRLPAHEVPR